MQDVVLITVLAPLVFAAALATGLGLAWMVQRGWQRPGLLLPAMVCPMLLLFALTSLTDLGGMGSPETTFANDGRHWSVALLSKVTSVALMGAALERILFRLGQSGRFHGMRLALLLGFTLFWYSNVLSPMMFGTHRLVSHEYVYSLVLGWAALMSLEDDGATMIRSCRDGLLCFLLLGLPLVPLAPQLVMSDIGPALLPWPETRYSGLAGHPNHLGPLAVAFLLCLWHSPWERRWLNWLGGIVAFGSLVLAGSKTTLLAFLPIAAAVLLARYGAMVPLLWRDPRYSRVLVALTGMAMLGFILACALLLAIDLDRIEAWLRGNEGAATVTLTGRDVIWRAAIEEWQRSPFFGYGLSLWDAAFRAKVNAYHAHNQFLQSLAVGGLVGAIGLVSWVLLLGTAAVRTAHATRGFSIGLFTLLIVRSFTEIPLTLSGYGSELLMQLLLMMAVASTLPDERKKHLPGSAPILCFAR